jgi:hypothetical protein
LRGRRRFGIHRRRLLVSIRRARNSMPAMPVSEVRFALPDAGMVT